MLIEQLALTYKCHSSIGNSLELGEMLKDVMKTILTETFALYAGFHMRKNDGTYKEIMKVGRTGEFHIEDYAKDIDIFLMTEDKTNENHVIVFTPLKRGVLVVIYDKDHHHLKFLGSMFQGLAHKLNISIDSCLNMEIVKQKNEKLKTFALKLEGQKRDLEEANRFKNDFLANMSHELKTPLNSVIAISSVMKKNRKGKLDEEQVKNMNIINSCGHDLLYLINDILDISKIEAGELALDLKKVSLKNLIEELYDAMKPLAEAKNLSFVNSMSFDEVEILSDDARIKQILKNLLSNAFKFTKNGTVEMKSYLEDERVIIEVKDQGIGISEDKIEHIFDRFKQADGSTTRKHGGTGLGLAISKELSHLLGGDITATSVVSKGSTFRVDLPLKTVIKNVSDFKVEISSEDDTQESGEVFFFSQPKKEPEVVADEEKGKVLIVNPEHLLFFPVVVALKKNSIGFENVHSVGEAFAKIVDNEYDAMILNGYELEGEPSLALDEAINKDMKIVCFSEKTEIKANLSFKKKDINSSTALKIVNLITRSTE